VSLLNTADESRSNWTHGHKSLEC